MKMERKRVKHAQKLEIYKFTIFHSLCHMKRPHNIYNSNVHCRYMNAISYILLFRISLYF